VIFPSDSSSSDLSAIESNDDESGEVCPICYNEISAPSDVGILTSNGRQTCIHNYLCHDTCFKKWEEQPGPKQCIACRVPFDKIVTLTPTEQQEAISRLFDLFVGNEDDFLSEKELGSALRTLLIKPEVYGEFLSEKESKSGVGRDRFMQLLGDLKVQVGIAKTQNPPAPVQEPFYQPPSAAIVNREQDPPAPVQEPFYQPPPAAIANREMEIDNREMEIDNREIEIDNREMEIDNREMEIDNREVEIDNREIEIESAVQVPQQQYMSRCCDGLARCGSTICCPITSGYRCFKDSLDNPANVGCYFCLSALVFYIVPPVVSGCGILSLLAIIGNAPACVGLMCCCTAE
jgi:hypothetical protein